MIKVGFQWWRSGSRFTDCCGWNWAGDEAKRRRLKERGYWFLAVTGTSLMRAWTDSEIGLGEAES